MSIHWPHAALSDLVKVLQIVNAGQASRCSAILGDRALERLLSSGVAISDSPEGGVTENAAATSLNSVLYDANSRLAVYGSLAPGKPNHDVISPLQGSWRRGRVRGSLRQIGWGDAMGFPGMRWQPEGSLIPVELFESLDLPNHWSRLDAFEGSDYRRILIPVALVGCEAAATLVVANIYEVIY